jgi:hypothetical protein
VDERIQVSFCILGKIFSQFTGGSCRDMMVSVDGEMFEITQEIFSIYT